MLKLRRAVAWLIDFALVVAAACVLAVLTFHRISALVTDVPELATRSGLDLLSSRGDVLGASERFGLSLWDRTVQYVEEAFGLLVLATFLYQWVCLALAGRTVGKGLLGLRVAPVGPFPARRARPAALRAAVTTAADVAVYAVACVLLIEGHLLLSVLVWLLAVLVFLLNAVPVLLPARRSLADRVAGTVVSGLGLPPAPGTPGGPGHNPPTGPGYGPPAYPGYGTTGGPGHGDPAGPGYGPPTGGHAGGPGYGPPAGPGYGNPGGPGRGTTAGPGFSTPGATPPARTS
ncbi:RDD family protein [Streptomyces sp. NPDC015220]|uniref:RDD family protein n=1 Tax=Streptomyces sp. NPDC015220 TaxID=3364947 RepID=UPI0037030E5A